MTIEPVSGEAGVNVHLDQNECELFMQLARDAAKAAHHEAAPTYFTVCLQLGERIGEALGVPLCAHDERPALANRMVALILGDLDATE